jgi:hypothetical protein
MAYLKFIGVGLGAIFLAQVAPRLLIRSDLERFFGAEGPAIQYTGTAHTLTRQAYCGSGPAAFTCTAVRVVDLKHRNNSLREGGRSVAGCAFPYTATAKVYSWFGIPVQTINIDCNLGTSLER